MYQIKVQGWQLAHKRVQCRRKISERDKREIEIMRRLSNIHIIQLIGTYTWRRFLGLLLYPIAVCDMHTFFEDVEAWTTLQADKNPSSVLGSTIEARLKALDYDFPGSQTHTHALPIYTKIGCLVSAIAYLHEQQIRHQDSKPSNILISRDRLWLSDFGSATDFTALS